MSRGPEFKVQLKNSPDVALMMACFSCPEWLAMIHHLNGRIDQSLVFMYSRSVAHQVAHIETLRFLSIKEKNARVNSQVNFRG